MGYRVKDGKIGRAVKGATLIGDGATALQRIRGLGNDMALDPGMGNCGKQCQWVPVDGRCPCAPAGHHRVTLARVASMELEGRAGSR